MTAADIRDVLHNRFSPRQYVCIEEAPTGPWRQGGIDFVAISCWKSRRYEIDAIEIKVSYSDWKNELLKPWKNDWWFRHSHRAWIACPSSLALRIGPELPHGWGLLSVTDVCTIYRNAEHRREPEAMDWSECVGLMRALAGASYTALDRAYDRGRRDEKDRADLMAQVEDQRLARVEESS